MGSLENTATHHQRAAISLVTSSWLTSQFQAKIQSNSSFSGCDVLKYFYKCICKPRESYGFIWNERRNGFLSIRPHRTGFTLVWRQQCMRRPESISFPLPSTTYWLYLDLLSLLVILEIFFLCQESPHIPRGHFKDTLRVSGTGNMPFF